MKLANIKHSSNYPFKPQAPKRDLSLAMATGVALAVHALLIFGISFSNGASPDEKMREVATVLTQDMTENKDANFIANATQEGSGEVRQQLRLETTQISPLQDDEMNETQDIINLQRQIRQQQYQQSYLQTTLSWREVDKAYENEDNSDSDAQQAQEDRLRKEIATLEAQLSQKQQFFAKKTKIQTVDSNSTTHGKASQYLERFRQHVEGVATKNYPDRALSQHITGDVRLMVIIKADGNVKAIRLLESSGSPMLDEAAKQSVRQASPFGQFDDDMDDILELRVIRTWRYHDSIAVSY